MKTIAKEELVKNELTLTEPIEQPAVAVEETTIISETKHHKSDD